jgi:hypothetical protein
MTIWTDQFRLDALQRLEHEERDIDTKIVQLRERKSELHGAKARYRFPLPDHDLCPKCWFRCGLRSPMFACRCLTSERQTRGSAAFAVMWPGPPGDTTMAGGGHAMIHECRREGIHRVGDPS